MTPPIYLCRNFPKRGWKVTDALRAAGVRQGLTLRHGTVERIIDGDIPDALPARLAKCEVVLADWENSPFPIDHTDDLAFSPPIQVVWHKDALIQPQCIPLHLDGRGKWGGLGTYFPWTPENVAAFVRQQFDHYGEGYVFVADRHTQTGARIPADLWIPLVRTALHDPRCSGLLLWMTARAATRRIPQLKEASE